MHIGIIAACLPTMKPLFANFFGQIRTLTKGRTTGSGGISTPFKSSGYMKHNGDHTPGSFAMKNLSEASSQSRTRDPYDEDVMLGKESYSAEAGVGRGRRVRSQAGESDESILPHQDTSGRLSPPRGMMIVRTTEVNVTR